MNKPVTQSTIKVPRRYTSPKLTYQEFLIVHTILEIILGNQEETPRGVESLCAFTFNEKGALPEFKLLADKFAAAMDELTGRPGGYRTEPRPDLVELKLEREELDYLNSVLESVNHLRYDQSPMSIERAIGLREKERFHNLWKNVREAA